MDKKEFELKKELFEIEHKFKLEELKFECECKKEVEVLRHEKELERQRIKSAEIRKHTERKSDLGFMNTYSK